MIEIIAATIEDAKRIERCGADRIELVSALSEGGLTPSYGTIQAVVAAVGIPVNVIIRPHAKTFLYENDEIEAMKADIRIARELGANGVVLGALDAAGNICVSTLEALLSVCDGLDVTFHRAIDELRDPVEGVALLAEYPMITNILTSGGQGRLADNFTVIRNMRLHAAHIRIMVGGGLNFDNFAQARQVTGGGSFHFGRAVRIGEAHNGDIDEAALRRLVAIAGQA